MKAIQITVEPSLLKEIDATEEARTHGRSAVFRHAAAEYLRRGRESTIAREYARAYGQDASLGEEFEGWTEQAEWPTK